MLKNKVVLILLIVFMLAIIGCDVQIEDDAQNIDISEPPDIDSTEQMVTDANVDFAINIFKSLNEEDPSSNIFISPFSISTALSMTYNGAVGQTKEDMATALQYSNIDIETVNSTYKSLINYLQQADTEVDLMISNSIWYREGEAIKEDFINTNKDFYNAEVKAINFSDDGAADIINNWIEDSTRGKIDKMINPPIDRDVIMYLINAVYFKGDWTNQFDKSQTFSTNFNNIKSEKTPIEMMNRHGEVEYTNNDDYKAVRLPYGQEKIAMYVVLPSENIDINSFIENFTTDKLNSIKENVSITDGVNLQIPKFKLEYGIKNLNNSLSSLGMGSAFGSSADFSKIRDDLFISRVLHKAVIEVNEEGSEAAAVTVVEMKLTSVREPIDFIADRPFIFFIIDESTDTILFLGKYCMVE